VMMVAQKKQETVPILFKNSRLNALMH